jgi:hypothetical protein
VVLCCMLSFLSFATCVCRSVIPTPQWWLLACYNAAFKLRRIMSPFPCCRQVAQDVEAKGTSSSISFLVELGKPSVASPYSLSKSSRRSYNGLLFDQVIRRWGGLFASLNSESDSSLRSSLDGSLCHQNLRRCAAPCLSKSLWP